MIQLSNNDCITVIEAAKDLGVTRIYILQLVKQGKLKAKLNKEGTRERYEIDLMSYTRFKQGREKMARLKKELKELEGK